jgi:flagellar basal body-associated protein FliL
MAEKAEKKEGAAEKGAEKGAAPKEAAEKSAKSGGLMAKTPVVLGIVMVVEAVLLLAGVKMLGGGPKTVAGADTATTSEAHDGGDAHGAADPKPDAHGGDAHASGGHDAGKPAGKVDKKKHVEVAVVDFRAPNKQSGRTFLYDVTIFISVRADAEEKTKAILTERSALIKDRIRTIIAQSDPEKLGGGSEPGLETLRRQVKYQLDELVGDGVIDEVLVPRCIPFPVNY